MPTGQIASQTNYLEMSQHGQTLAPPKKLEATEWAKRVHMSASNNSVLIVVHGFNVLQHTFTKEVANVRRRLTAKGFKGAVVGYDWPADGGIFNYWSDWNDAQETAKHLVIDGIGTLIRSKPNTKIHILAHSMGCYVISKAILEAWNDPKHRHLTRSIDQVVMTAADVELKLAEPDDWVGQMAKLGCNRMTSYISDRDLALSFSESQGHPGTLRLGRNRPTFPASSDFVSVDCSTYYTNTISRLSNLRLSHNWYYREPNFYADALEALNGRMSTGRRRQLADGHFEFKKPN